MKNIFVTGGAGYVGSSLVPLLINKGYDVTVLDLMIYGEKVLPKHEKLKIVKGDIRNQNLLKKIIPGHDCIIHLACISNDPSFELNPSLGKQINLDSFVPLVEISKSFGIERFIYASTSSVSENLTIAAFEAAYALNIGIGFKAPAPESCIIFPFFTFLKYGNTARHIRTDPKRFISVALIHFFQLISSTFPFGPNTPALLIKTSIFLNSLRVFLTNLNVSL
ncbi:MAG: NAD-dependent epimerase/dehydratase family protein [Pelagibacteraceae bacterium]|nr:NAD-dependent epimerase/dehydratase family protein [Pelagibacteraceae bacterium]